ncbi:MAG: hypothetical protein ACTHN4_06600 [Sphingomicrobium sp.]
MRVFTREQFHALVWSKPMTSLAKEFFLSDVALHKICRKHDVPTPPPGWWAKQQAGRKVKVTPLPKLKAGISDRIAIAAGELRSEAGALAAVRERARVLASCDLPGEITAPPVVVKTVSALRKARPGATGLVTTDGSLIRCEVAPASIDRVEPALTRIVAAAAQQGFTLKPRGKDVCFSGADEEIGFSVTETVRRIKHVLTEREQAEQQRCERKREREIRSGSWGMSWSERPRFPEWDYHPTGQLAFEFEHAYVSGAPRRTFRDGKVQRVEDMAADIAVGLAVLAAAKTADRLQREERRRHEEEQRRLREQAARASHLEERRAAAVDQILAEMQRVEQLTALLTQLSENAGGGDRVREFRLWIEAVIERSRSRLACQALEERFTASRLFGDDDDYGFRAPYY